MRERSVTVARRQAAVFETKNFGDIMHAVQRSRVGVTRESGGAGLGPVQHPIEPLTRNR